VGTEAWVESELERRWSDRGSSIWKSGSTKL